jgi:hypothetical protein
VYVADSVAGVHKHIVFGDFDEDLLRWDGDCWVVALTGRVVDYVAEGVRVAGVVKLGDLVVFCDEGASRGGDANCAGAEVPC